MYPLLLLTLTALPGQVKDAPKVGGRPLTFWIDELKSTNPLHREEALMVLADLGAAAKEALPAAEKLLEDDRPGVRRQVAFAVGQLGGSTKHAARVLVEDLNDPETYKQQRAVQALIKLGPA